MIVSDFKMVCEIERENTQRFDNQKEQSTDDNYINLWIWHNDWAFFSTIKWSIDISLTANAVIIMMLFFINYLMYGTMFNNMKKKISHLRKMVCIWRDFIVGNNYHMELHFDDFQSDL